MKREKVMRLLAPIAHRAMFEGFGGDGARVTVTIPIEKMRVIVDAYAKLWHKKQRKFEKRQKWMVKR